MQLISNDDWSASADKAAISAAGTGLPLADPSTDAALLVELDEGAYSAQATSADGSSDEVLVEVDVAP